MREWPFPFHESGNTWERNVPAWAYGNAAMPFRELFGMGNVVGNGDGNGENFIFFTDFLLFSAARGGGLHRDSGNSATPKHPTFSFVIG